MFSSVFVIFLIFGLTNISNGIAINSKSDNVAIEMAIPRDFTREEYVKSIIDYWTPDRMASAQPMEQVISKMSRTPFANIHQNNQPPRVLTPSAPLKNSRAATPPAAGRAFFTMNGLNYVCSGSVVNAGNRDTIVTAGHCVYNTTSKEYATKWTFIPNYDSGVRPHGTFVWRKIVTKEKWMSNADYNHDCAIVTVNLNENGQHVQDVTGAFGIYLNAQKKAQTNAFGFPMNINNGETMSTCSATSTNPSLLLLSSFKGLQITCNMGGGASGGPWLQNYNSVTNSGDQVSLTSFGYSFAPGKIHGPHFNDDNIGSLFDEHENS